MPLSLVEATALSDQASSIRKDTLAAWCGPSQNMLPPRSCLRQPAPSPDSLGGFLRSRQPRVSGSEELSVGTVPLSTIEATVLTDEAKSTVR